MTTQQTAAGISDFRSETSMIDGVQLHYWIGGDPAGRPVILWHGFLGTGYSWHKVAPLLAGAGMAVLVPDMRGYGDSDKPDGDDGYDVRSLAKEFRALVKAIGFGGGRPLILAGHDMGAPPTLIWAADHPAEVAGLVYIEGPTMLLDGLQHVFAYNRASMEGGSMWWWLVPLAAGVPERLIVGHERAFLEWFYDKSTVDRATISPATVDEYLRSFAGREGVLGSMGVYRAQFTSIEQTTPLVDRQVDIPVVALGGAQSLASSVGELLGAVATKVEAHVIADCGHFIPEERPEEVVRHILALAARTGASALYPNFSRSQRR